MAEEKKDYPQIGVNSVEKQKAQELKSEFQDTFDQFESRFPEKTPDGWDERRWRVYKSLLKRSWMDIKDIDYYCIVLDQFQQPVEGAEVFFEVSQIPEDVSTLLETKEMSRRENKTVKVISNKQGIARLTGVRGDSFDVKYIIKPGYSYVPANKRYSFQVGGNKPLSSPDKPVKLYIFDNAVSEPLYKRSFYKRIKHDDTWEIDILRRNKKGPTPEQINLSISCRQLKEQYGTRDCELTVMPSSGIEIALASRYSCLADGLSPNKLIIEYDGKGYKKQYFIFYHDVDQDFYSKIMIDVTGDQREPKFRITSFSNPIKGSKVLSYVKSKELKKWLGVIDPDKK